MGREPHIRKVRLDELEEAWAVHVAASRDRPASPDSPVPSDARAGLASDPDGYFCAVEDGRIRGQEAHMDCWVVAAATRASWRAGWLLLSCIVAAGCIGPLEPGRLPTDEERCAFQSGSFRGGICHTRGGP